MGSRRGSGVWQRELQRQTEGSVPVPVLLATCFVTLDKSLHFFGPLLPHLLGEHAESHDLRGPGPFQPPSAMILGTLPVYVPSILQHLHCLSPRTQVEIDPQHPVSHQVLSISLWELSFVFSFFPLHYLHSQQILNIFVRMIASPSCLPPSLPHPVLVPRLNPSLLSHPISLKYYFHHERFLVQKPSTCTVCL